MTKICYLIFIIELFSLITLIYFYLILSKIHTSKDYLYLNNNSACKPFYSNTNQYYAIIDGVQYPKSVPYYQNKSINFECLNANARSKPLKRILLWNTFFNTNYSGYGLGKIEPFVQNKCPVYSCELTVDRSLVNQSDYVVVHMLLGADFIEPIPKFRHSNQTWVFLLLESPENTKNNFSDFQSVFSLTATYKLESEFRSFYYSQARMEWALNEKFDKNRDYQEGKTKLAAALISNCGAKSPRSEYINNLKKYIDVDVLGECGEKCPNDYRKWGSKFNCKTLIARKYLFFLSFENSLCQDYITEKFFQTISYDIIPVVMGGGPYDYYV